MMYSQVCWLLLLVITAGVRVDCDGNDIPLIQWDADCDSYDLTSGVYPVDHSMEYEHSTTLDECRSLCTGRTDCGGFAWWVGDVCRLYNINAHIIKQYISKKWYTSGTSVTWYSKSCEYNLGDTDLSCNSYTETDQFPSAKWALSLSRAYISDLNATDCQGWCTVHTGCRSVTYWRYNPDGSGWCHIFPTTIQDLLDKGLNRDVRQTKGTMFTITTFDRHCADGSPYVPADQK